jgi:hypothetical protein
MFAGLNIKKPPSRMQIDDLLSKWVDAEKRISQKVGAEHPQSGTSTEQKQPPSPPTFYAWGSDQYTQLGCGGGDDRQVPHIISSLPTCLDVRKGRIKTVRNPDDSYVLRFT